MNLVRDFISYLTLLGLVQFSHSVILRVPDDFERIMWAVNASQAGDTIVLSPAIYYEQINLENRNLTISSDFLLTNDTIYIALTKLILHDSIRFSTSRLKSIIRIRNCSNVRIVGLTLERGYGTFPTITSNFNYGGAIYGDSSRVLLDDLRIKNSFANSGGGISFRYSSVYINKCLVDSCIGSGSLRTGGGLFLNNCDSVDVRYSTFQNNQHITNSSGGLFISTNYGIISHCIIRDNYAAFAAGAGSIFGVHVYNSIIANNISPWHGGIELQPSTDSTILLFSNNFIENNVTTAFGSATAAYFDCYARPTSGFRITGNVFLNNNANNSQGGAMGFQNGSHVVKNNIYIRNSAYGSSVILARMSSIIQFDSNYVEDNSAPFAIDAYTQARVQAQWNDFIGNRGMVCNSRTDSSMIMINNYWGHPSGPRTASNPGGLGDSLPDGIPYIPFRTTPVFPELDVKDYGNGSERGQNGLGLPITITIEKVYPIPTNSTLTVHYTISRPQLIVLKLYDTNGREVYASHPQPQIAGSHTFLFQTEGIASGLYFLKLSSPTTLTETALLKVVLLK